MLRWNSTSNFGQRIQQPSFLSVLKGRDVGHRKSLLAPFKGKSTLIFSLLPSSSSLSLSPFPPLASALYALLFSPSLSLFLRKNPTTDPSGPNEMRGWHVWLVHTGIHTGPAGTQNWQQWDGATGGETPAFRSPGLQLLFPTACMTLDKQLFFSRPHFQDLWIVCY